MPCTICVLLLGFGVRTRRNRLKCRTKVIWWKDRFLRRERFWSLVVIVHDDGCLAVHWVELSNISMCFLSQGRLQYNDMVRNARFTIIKKAIYNDLLQKGKICSALLSPIYPDFNLNHILPPTWFTSLALLLWGSFDAILKSNPPWVTRNEVEPGLTSWT